MFVCRVDDDENEKRPCSKDRTGQNETEPLIHLFESESFDKL